MHKWMGGVLDTCVICRILALLSVVSKIERPGISQVLNGKKSIFIYRIARGAPCA